MTNSLFSPPNKRSNTFSKSDELVVFPIEQTFDKKNKKFFQKPIDKPCNVWYNKDTIKKGEIKMTILTVNEFGKEVTIMVHDDGTVTKLNNQAEINEAMAEIAKANKQAKKEEEKHPWWWYQGMNEEPGRIKWNGDR